MPWSRRVLLLAEAQSRNLTAVQVKNGHAQVNLGYGLPTNVLAK
ncbi:hypothetical protein RMSM_06740 [Rhodopirellula maiorica SM1]|uniref:Uncharacterized protein n=1 Tax=Rhodopirellula maiorica SM1 TaxID=1265738 RepID=M5RBB4_9BACT|nr:hypothetical protein [Rhodopirellula maiorica]EMI16336.1 hypothetical protein RMSM_06740 [Rhodopirellula maiorica SM1]